jgi:hypothetical protein
VIAPPAKQQEGGDSQESSESSDLLPIINELRRAG